MWKRSAALFVFVVVPFLGGCNEWLKVQLKAQNNETVNAAVSIERKGKQGESYGPKDFMVNSKAEVSQEFQARKGGEVSIKYRFSDSDIWIQAEPRTVPNELPPGEDSLSVVQELRPIQQWNQADAKQSLISLANTVEGTPGFPKTDPEDARQGVLGWLQIIDCDRSGNYKGKLWEYRLAPTMEKIPQHGLNISRNTKVINRDIFSDASLTIPLYADISNKFESNSLYNTSWEVQHYAIEYINGDFVVDNSMTSIPAATKASILSILQQNPNAKLIYVHRLAVVQSAIFSYKAGRSVKDTAKASIMTVAKGSFVYSFEESETQYASVPPSVVGIKYFDFGDYTKVKELTYFKSAGGGTSIMTSGVAETETPSGFVRIKSNQLPGRSAPIILGPVMK